MNVCVCDSTPFVVGVITLLKQFHSDDTHAFVELLCQVLIYVRMCVCLRVCMNVCFGIYVVGVITLLKQFHLCMHV